MRTRSQNKKIGETVRTVNIVSLVIICGGFLLLLLDISELMNKIGQSLIVGCVVLIVLTIIFQMMAASKMRKMK
ncbi:MAG: hypothetical protein FWE78_03995 [Methanimicrococcus sp.]|nr:hypothetical protein [Methanimicrococcus sp.]